MALSQPLRQAVRRWGPSVQGVAHQYGISGEALLAKLIQGESGGRDDRTSSAGAQGFTQFMPGTRRISIDRYGVDPLAGADQAVHAAALHLRGKLTGSKGLEGYNPGGGRGYVDYILNQRVGDVGGRSGSGGASAGSDSGGLASRLTGSVTPGQVTGGGFDPGTPPEVSSLADLLSKPQPQAPQLPAAPFSTSKYLHMGVSPVVTPQAPQGGLEDALAAVQSSGQEIPQTSVSGAQTSVSGSVPTAHSASTGTGARGRVIVPEGANRPGVGLTPGIMRVVSAVAGRIGHPLTVATGTRHNRLTVDGNVSDHWSGNATDLATTPGEQNIRLGRNALIALGVPRSQAMKATGGIYNIPYGRNRRIQVIFNTNEGGNHHDHVHIGVSGQAR